MNETCDRCGLGTVAAYRADRAGLFLLFCGHCAQANWLALSARGWLITPLTSTATVPQLTPPPSFEETWPELAK